MAPRKKKIDYRRLKTLLNPYVKFSFNMPRKGKDFLPQQKSAITRQWKKLKGVIENPKDNTFIKYKKGGGKYRGVDGLRTNKGIFINEKKAKIKYNKDIKKYVSYYFIGQYSFIDFVFPKDIIRNTDLIEIWVDYLIKKYKYVDVNNEPIEYEEGEIPEGYDKKLYQILWLRHMTRVGNAYEPETFYKYFDPNDELIDFDKDPEEKEGPKIGSIIGVTLVFLKWVKRKRQ